MVINAKISNNTYGTCKINLNRDVDMIIVQCFIIRIIGMCTLWEYQKCILEMYAVYKTTGKNSIVSKVDDLFIMTCCIVVVGRLRQLGNFIPMRGELFLLFHFKSLLLLIFYTMWIPKRVKTKKKKKTMYDRNNAVTSATCAGFLSSSRPLYVRVQ